MKKLLLAASVAASASACAANDSNIIQMGVEQWVTNNGYDYAVRGVNVDTENHFPIMWMATTYTREDGVYSVGIMRPDQECLGFEDTTEPMGVMKWNGTLVKMSNQCAGMALGFMFPSSQRGANYVWGQFVKSNYVYTVLDKVNIRFSAKGFAHAANKLKEIQEAL